MSSSLIKYITFEFKEAAADVTVHIWDGGQHVSMMRKGNFDRIFLKKCERPTKKKQESFEFIESHKHIFFKIHAHKISNFEKEKPAEKVNRSFAKS